MSMGTLEDEMICQTALLKIKLCILKLGSASRSLEAVSLHKELERRKSRQLSARGIRLKVLIR